MKLLFAILLSIIAAFAHAQATENRALEFGTVFSSEITPKVSCYRIPALITAPNGDLIAASDQRVPSCNDLNKNKDINIVIRRSTDNGNTWSGVETVIDYPFGKSASDPSMIVDNTTQAIFLFFNFMDLSHRKKEYRLMLTQSTDNGKSWQNPVDVTSQITQPGWKKHFKFITSGRGIQTKSGMLIHTLVNLQKGLFLFGSKDNGKSWFLFETPIKPGDESKIIELSDGRWMINSRVNGKGIRYVHTSADEGKTWKSEPDSSLPDPGCNASIIRYGFKNDSTDQNRILFVNANDAKERKNLTVKISFDEGKSWSAGKTIYAGNSAYSSISILANGNLGVLFEKDTYNTIAFTQFTLQLLTDGKDLHRE